jgi:hypothetical protein
VRKLVIVLGAVLLMAVGAVAYASIPGPDGVIHACYKNSNPAQGALIAIDSAASCPSGYTALNWNQTGPQGPAGADGVSGYEHSTPAFADAQEVATGVWAAGPATAICPTGKVVLGGGVQVDGGNTTLSTSYSWPGDVDRWVGAAHGSYDFGGINVYAICATAS